jgi:hypothetical protein
VRWCNRKRRLAGLSRWQTTALHTSVSKLAARVRISFSFLYKASNPFRVPFISKTAARPMTSPVSQEFRQMLARPTAHDTSSCTHCLYCSVRVLNSVSHQAKTDWGDIRRKCRGGYKNIEMRKLIRVPARPKAWPWPLERKVRGFKFRTRLGYLSLSRCAVLPCARRRLATDWPPPPSKESCQMSERINNFRINSQPEQDTRPGQQNADKKKEKMKTITQWTRA